MANTMQLLIVEDDPGLQKQLKWSFDKYDVLLANDKKSTLEKIQKNHPHVVTLDLGLPPDPDGSSEGLSTLEEIMRIAPSTKVIMVTGNDDRHNAVIAIGMGAYDFYQKPIDAEVLDLIVDRAFKVYELEEENRKLTDIKISVPLPGVIATSHKMVDMCRMIEKVAPTNVSVLLLGESGTGKEVLANALHKLSARTDRNLVVINCAAIPDNLLESELFGYEKGAFTGATQRTIGKIEKAEGGTLFLDEIGDLPFNLQAKLLRFLQERVIERLGSTTPIAVDVRIISATHQNIKNFINDGKFREDLYYRLSEVTIKIPPLRQRLGDILLLAHAFLDGFAKEEGKQKPELSPVAIKALERHDWPGNIRELINKLKRAFILMDGNVINENDLELGDISSSKLSFDLRRVREEAEKHAISCALSINANNISNTAKLLGISRPTLYDLIHKYGLNRDGNN